MKKATIIILIFISFSSLLAETNEPCKGVIVPAAIHNYNVIFEMPTYDEYVHGVVLESLISGNPIADDNILTEATYNKVRKTKIKIIKSSYANDFQIMTKAELKSKQITSGFVFQEKFLSDFISESSTKFEEYTSFSVEDINTSTMYTLVDPSQGASSNCIVKKGEYKYADLLEIIQK